MSCHPFTFAEASACPSKGPQFVQVLIGKVPTCARVREGWVAQDGTFLWSVSLLSPFHGHGSFPEHRVRQCSNLDGHCVCAQETAHRAELATHEGAVSSLLADRNFCQAGVVAPPDSPKNGKTPVSMGA